MSVATDPANQFKFVAPETPKMDFAERTLQDRMDAFYKRYPDANRNGHLWSVSLGD